MLTEKQSGQATVSKKRWKYEEIMAFLQPFLLERETLTNITVNTGEEAEEEELEEDLSEPFPSSLHNLSSAESSSTSSLPAVQASSTSSTPSSRQRGVKRKQPEESAASTLMQYLLASQVKDDPTDNFLASIGASIKRLSAMRQLQAKNKIYNLVSSMELEQLLEDTANGS